MVNARTKYTNIIIAIIVLLNLAFFAVGWSNVLVFWAVIIIAWIFIRKTHPRL